jgi:hypothetical protein
MPPILKLAVLLVHAALICYTVGIALEQRSRRASRAVVGWLTVGVLFDIAATAGMIVATDRGLITLHGMLGYSALTAMLVDTVRVWRHRLAEGDAPVPRALHFYSRYAYAWWVIAFVSGAALAMMALPAK